MVHETKTRLLKKEQNKSSKKRDEQSHKKKKNHHSDSDENSYFSESETEEEEENEMDPLEYKKFLSKLFPSKHLERTVKAGKNLKKVLKKDLDLEEEESSDYEDEEQEKAEEEEKVSKKNKKKTTYKKQQVKSSKKTKKQEEDEEEEYSSDSTEESEVVVSKKDKKSEKVNIIFTIGGENYDDEYDEEYDEDEEWEDMSDYETENEDDPLSDDSSSSEEEEEEQEEKEKEKGKGKEQKVVEVKNKKPKKEEKKNLKEDVVTCEENKQLVVKGKSISSENNSSHDSELLQQLNEIYEKNKENKAVLDCIQLCEKNIKKNKKKIEKKEQKYKDRNVRIFKKIIKDKNVMNDYNFFEKLEMENQKKIIKELKEINKLTRIEKPYRITLLESNIPTLFKGAAMKKINSLRYMEPGSGEYYKIKNWVDTFMKIPFDKYHSLPININDGVDKCHEFMESSQKILDNAVHGLNDAKMQIMQMLGQLITNPNALGSAIAIQGPPGTGKTSLLKEGISKILNRPFAFIALGGATDSSFLEGHSYTYEGSTWGKIVQILLDSKCMNPVIYFDELDKISETPKGEEITGILTHLTDSTQNSQFHDKYFAEIDFDLSKCLFIFSYNDESKVNPILKDRMYRIQTKGYNLKQKTIISNNYLLPKIREQVLFTNEDIIIPDETLHYIIDNFCNKEEGVRNLKRCLEIVYTKLNLYRLMKPGTNLFEQDMSIKVEFPFQVTKSMVDKLIKIGKEENMSYKALYI